MHKDSGGPEMGIERQGGSKMSLERPTEIVSNPPDAGLVTAMLPAFEFGSQDRFRMEPKTEWEQHWENMLQHAFLKN